MVRLRSFNTQVSPKSYLRLKNVERPAAAPTTCALPERTPERYFMYRISIALILGLTLTASAPLSFAGPADALSGALLKNYAYRLTDDQKQTLDRINRDLRQASDKERRAETDKDRQDAKVRYANASTELNTLLETVDWAIPIRLDGKRETSPAIGPLQLPSDRWCLLLRVETGTKKTHFQTMDCDFAETGNLDVEALEPNAVSWVLAELSHVPLKLTSFLIRLETASGVSASIPVQLRVPAEGAIRIEVLSDDTGKPAPAMVRLIWKIDGRDRKPSNAIEFAPQFDRQGDHTGNRNARYLPGKLAGRYWCVPGPFSMAIPPGEWEITVRRGMEHVPVTDSFKVTAGETVKRTYRPERWVDMRDRGWYSGDDHVHCRIVSDVDAQRLMAWIQAEDIHLANVVKMGDISRTWFEQRGFGKLFRTIDKDYVLSPGQECPRTHSELGHTISMNITDMVRDTSRYYLYDYVFDTVHEQGGLTGYCHVLFDMFFVHRDMSVNIPKGKVDFAEIMQFGQLGTELYYAFLNLGYKLTASAGSDVPWGGTVGEERIYAHLGEKQFSADAWFKAMQEGETFVSNGPVLEFEVDGAGPGDEIRVAKDRKLRVRARAWGDKRRTLPKQLEIIRHGEVIESVESVGQGEEELKLDFEVDAGNGCWLAVRAEGHDGTYAHSTPVYVVREGLRFWKFEDLEGSISERVQSLDEIEKLVADAQRADGEGTLEADRTLKQLSLQGPALLERVRAAREIYTTLHETAERERSVRSRVTK